MQPTIQRVSPSITQRWLLPHPHGTYLVRYPTGNDQLISMIRKDNHSKQEISINRYVVLSVRVDETVYTYEIEHYLLPFNAQNPEENNKQLLEPYNRERKNFQNGRFTPLRQELIVSHISDSCMFDKRSLKDLEFVKTNGSFNDGTYTATWHLEKQHDLRVFIKSFKKNSPYFKHELALLKELSHFSIITLYGYYSDGKLSYLVFEDGGKSLEDHCPLVCPSPKGKMRFIANVGYQVSQAMMYLEKKNIIHRDLTAGNVLLNSYGYIRVADFGHAIKKEVGKNSLERSQSQTGVQHFQFRFLPPECLYDVKLQDKLGNRIDCASNDLYARFSSKSDVWSYGILLIQLMLDNPHTPYPQIASRDDILQYVKVERHIHPRPNGCPTDMYLVLERCWAYEPKERISFTELREKMLTLETILR